MSARDLYLWLKVSTDELRAHNPHAVATGGRTPVELKAAQLESGEYLYGWAKCARVSP